MFVVFPQWQTQRTISRGQHKQTAIYALFRKSHINTHTLCERWQQNALYIYPINAARANRIDVTRNGCLVSQEPVFIAFHLVSTG